MNFIFLELNPYRTIKDKCKLLRGMYLLSPIHHHHYKTNAELDLKILELAFPGYSSKILESIEPITDFDVDKLIARIRNKKHLDKMERFREKLKQTDRDEKDAMVIETLEFLKFWDHGYTRPDHEFWQRFDYWTQEEATLLACDLSPSKVKLKDIIEFRNYDKTPEKAADITDLYDRAVKVGSLQKEVAPLRFIEWCQSKAIELPKEFMAVAELVTKVDGPAIPKAPKKTRITPWHEVVKEICNEMGQVPQAHEMLKQLSTLAKKGHKVIMEVDWDEQKVHVSGISKPISRRTIENVLSDIRRKFPG